MRSKPRHDNCLLLSVHATLQIAKQELWEGGGFIQLHFLGGTHWQNTVVSYSVEDSRRQHIRARNIRIRCRPWRADMVAHACASGASWTATIVEHEDDFQVIKSKACEKMDKFDRPVRTILAMVPAREMEPLRPGVLTQLDNHSGYKTSSELCRLNNILRTQICEDRSVE